MISSSVLETVPISNSFSKSKSTVLVDTVSIVANLSLINNFHYVQNPVLRNDINYVIISLNGAVQSGDRAAKIRFVRGKVITNELISSRLMIFSTIQLKLENESICNKKQVN